MKMEETIYYCDNYYIIDAETKARINEFYETDVYYYKLIECDTLKAMGQGSFNIESDFEIEQTHCGKVAFIRYNCIEKGTYEYDEDGDVVRQLYPATFKLSF